MKFLFGDKDGGPDSKVQMYGFEDKELFSILVLRVGHGTRECYHSHAFDCVSRVLSGALFEDRMRPVYRTSRLDFEGRQLLPRKGWFKTLKSDFHTVTGLEPATWVLTIRGPWSDTWREYEPSKGFTTLTHGRKEV
jgi:hypothetical protein